MRKRKRLSAAEPAAPAPLVVDEWGATDSVIPEVWPGWAVALVDALALLCATVLAGYVLADATSADATSRVRAVAAVVFFVVVPGWALLRAVRARPSSLTLMCSVALSLAFTFLGGELLVTRLGFPWRGATILACGMSAMVLVVDLGARRWQ